MLVLPSFPACTAILRRKLLAMDTVESAEIMRLSFVNSDEYLATVSFPAMAKFFTLTVLEWSNSEWGSNNFPLVIYSF